LLAAESFLRYCSGIEASDGTLDDEAHDELKARIENVHVLSRRLTDNFIRE
jgi:hypothetical protein